MIKGVGQVVSLLLIFALILLFAYCSSKLAAKWQSNNLRNSNIEVIETMRVNGNKLIQIIRIGERYIAVGIGKDEVSYLTELDKDEIVFRQNPDSSRHSVPFKEIMEKVNEKRSSR